MGAVMSFEKNYMSIGKVISQLSESNKKKMGQINYDGINSAFKAAAQQLEPLQGMQESLTSAFKVAVAQSSFSEMIRQQYIDANIFSNRDIAKSMADILADTAVLTNANVATDMLKDIQFGLVNSSVSAITEAIQKTLNSSLITMADFSFLKNSELMKSLSSELIMPVGLNSVLTKTNKASLKRLAFNTNIVYNNDLRRFVSITNEDDYASASEMNVICRTEDFLELTNGEEVFTENELMNFMSFLDDFPMLAIDNTVGRKIYNLIRDFPFIIGFDKDKYYHCRARNKKDSPYVWEQMRCAPYGVTYPGRYNHAGQAYFYFSDRPEGAKNEILKHMSAEDKEEKELQVVEVGVDSEAKLIDLSGKDRRGLNTFFKYIRFPLEMNQAARPREYLIPCFVSDCCRNVGINGIKYYGGKDYSNYVTWQDSYYSFIRNV